MTDITQYTDYRQAITAINQRIQASQTRAVLAVERDIENQLVAQITRFLLELSKGFAFLGRQYPLVVNGRDYFLDLLFYHARLKCYVVIELKAGEFKPEYVGKLNFYLSAVDDQLRSEGDHPTIGLILCKDKDKLDLKYALHDIHKPMGVSSRSSPKTFPYRCSRSCPRCKRLRAS